MSFERGEQRAGELIRQAAIPQPFDVAEFCERIAGQRSRPLRLVAEPAGSMGDAVGLLVGLADRDEIHYVSDTSRYHQQAIVLHEVGHLLAEHDGRHSFPLSLLDGDWDPAVVQRLHGRHRYDDDEECEAEGFATAVLDHVDQQARRGGTRRSTPSAQAGGRPRSGVAAGDRLASMFLR